MRNTTKKIALALLACSSFCMAETVVFQQELNGYHGVRDGMLKGAREDMKAAGYWGGDTLDISGMPQGGFFSMGLIRFDDMFGTGPGKIPPGSMITSATLELYKTGDPGKGEGPFEKTQVQNRFIYLYEMLTPFHAGRPDEEADHSSTFSYRLNDTANPQFWGNRNRLETGPVKEVDYNPVSKMRIPLEFGTVETWYSVNLTELADRWSQGEKNFGLYLMAKGFWIGAQFASSQHLDQTLRPKLTIEYSKP